MRKDERVSGAAKSNGSSKKPNTIKRKTVKRQAVLKSSSWYERAASLFSELLAVTSAQRRIDEISDATLNQTGGACGKGNKNT